MTLSAENSNESRPRDARWARLLDAHRPAAVARAQSMLGDRHEAEDVFQDACLELMGKIDEFTDERAAAWIKIAVVHRAVDRLRRRRFSTPSASVEPAAQEKREDPDRRSAVDRALRRLTPRQKEIVVRRLIRNETFASLAVEIGISETTAKTHFSRGIDELKRMLSTEDEGKTA